ncbi:hypothetical protein BJ912DRAFT_1025446 [Pholiota molesta]|nr:hypothetical protein BJ912DRAFT_1025446 [Pholiota molesta]
MSQVPTTNVELVTDSEGRIICPDCSTPVNCGPGGLLNLEKRHRGSKACQNAKAKHDVDSTKKKNGSLLTFIKQGVQKPAFIPSTIFHAAVQALPNSIPEATSDDKLAVFSGHPSTYDDPSMEGDQLWEEVLNEQLKGALGWGQEADMDDIIQHGRNGLDGLEEFVKYFIVKCGENSPTY